MKKMNPVVHFEIPTADRKRVADFYTKAFGWQTQMLGEEMGNYVLATTTPVDQNSRMPTQPGAINGGFFEKTDDPSTHTPTVCIAVDNINEAMQNVVQAGGRVLGEPVEIPGIGMYVSFFDTENNRLTMMQPLMSQ